ncbi:MAG TPA: carboxymuconolactone decarboxylase family protein [Candidatus Binataceae bacterium]|nr:carboxymuconolactone decarboxylase family protein [Candidatus Binataceae bacterium]
MADIEKGIKKLGELVGDQGARGAYEFMKKFDAGFADVVFGTTFGDIWARPGLPTKLRSLVTVAGLVALGRPAELRAHLRGALHVGWTPEELKEVIIHLSQYAGIPTSLEAIREFEEVTKKKEAKA